MLWPHGDPSSKALVLSNRIPHFHEQISRTRHRSSFRIFIGYIQLLITGELFETTSYSLPDC
jgi:hypothetical protein